MFSIEFEWSWIKDKQIEVDGNQWSGLIYISDSDDNIVAIYQYKLVENE